VLEAHRKLDNTTELLEEALEKLDTITELIKEANDKLDRLLCPFRIEPLPLFVVLGQGCDGVDQNCNNRTDECVEDNVPPSIMLKHPIPTTAFQSIGAARIFLEDNLEVSDDCAANLVTDISLMDDAACNNCTFAVTVNDQRCIIKPDNERGLATGSRIFVLPVDSIPPVIACGFFTPQDAEHVSGGFDPSLGLSPHFPEEGDFLHVDAKHFDKEFIDVAFWYQIEVRY
jgi:hypothetical protein